MGVNNPWLGQGGQGRSCRKMREKLHNSKSKDKHSMGEMCNCALKLIKGAGPRKR